MLSQAHPLIPVTYYLVLSAILFALGVTGVLVRRNTLVMFMSVEMMLNAANLAFVAYSRYLGKVDGQVFVLLIMAVAAAEVAVGLAIAVAYVRHKDTTDADEMDLLKG